MKLCKLKFKFLSRFFPRLVNSKMLYDYLIANGVDIGKGTCFFNAGSICVDISRPALLHIGEYCKITQGTVILTHDYSRSVLRRYYGEIINEARKTYIGDNVFLGINSIVLMGTTIGNNCIVGAGSICSGKYPDNSVIAGNPARVIMTLEEYYQKRKSNSINEAKQYVIYYQNFYKKNPSIKDLGAFFPLYLERNLSILKDSGVKTDLSGDDEQDVIRCFLESKPVYSNFQAFLDDINQEKGNKND